MEENKKYDSIAMVSFFIMNAILLFKPDINGGARLILIALLWVMFYRMLPKIKNYKENNE